MNYSNGFCPDMTPAVECPTGLIIALFLVITCISFAVIASIHNGE